MNYTLLGLIIYLVLTLLIAWFYGRAKRDEDYLIAGRDLGVLSSMMTIVSSKVGAGFILSYVAYVYLWGPIAALVFLGTLIGFVLFIPFARYLKRQADEHKFYTLPEFYRSKFGVKTGFFMALLMCGMMLLDTSVQLIGGAHIVAGANGLSYNLSAFIVAGVVLLYLLLGGFRSVVATDFLQGLALLVLVPIFLTITIFAVGDLSVIDWTISEEGIKNVPSIIIVGIILPFSAPELWQRVYAMKDEKIVGKTLFRTAFVYSIFGILVTLLGLYFKSVTGDVLPETLFVSGFAQVLPSAMATLGIIFFMSAVMSSFDTYVFTAASVLVQDVISPKGREHRDKHAVHNLRLWTFLMIVAVLLIGIFIPYLIDVTVLSLTFYVIAGVTGIAVAIRREKLTPPFLALLFGTLAVLYAVYTIGIKVEIVMYGVMGSLLGLLISALWSILKKRRI